MNSDVVQNLRYKLQKRVRRLNSMSNDLFCNGLAQFWAFFRSHPTLVGIMDDLEARWPSAKEDAAKVVAGTEALFGETEEEQSAISLHVLRHCAEAKDENSAWHISNTYDHTKGVEEGVEYFRTLFLEPFYEYLDEQLDDQRNVLAMLRRYKHKCEWFSRDLLYQTWAGDTQKGEKKLALHLYEFLHDQGMEFSIEPQSISGRADLVAAQKSDDPLIADAKIFDPDRSKGKTYIAEGFAQVYRYTLDFNEPVGYLVIFLTGKKDLRFSLSEKAGGMPFVVYNNKTIFLITIDIFPHTESASKRGALTPIEITQDDLTGAATNILNKTKEDETSS